MEILLNPGPVNLSDRVRQALLRPDLCHREIEFTELQKNIRDGLLRIYGLDSNDWATVLMTGSGTSAVEAMITGCVPAHGKVVILENGVYGERMTRMINVHGINHLSLQHDWGATLDLKRLEDELRYHEETTHVAVVHHETTTGRLNDLAGIAAVCARYDVALLVDAVSSFAAEAIEFSDWNIAACAATANKCLHGVPGTSFVIVNRATLEGMQGTKPRTVYLDLAAYLQQQDAGGTPFTPSVQTFYALDEAIRELADEGGWQQRRKRYHTRMRIVTRGLHAAGIESLLPADAVSCVLNAFYLPDGLTYQQLHDHLKQHGFVIYAGQGQLADNIFRIACMGYFDDTELDRLVGVIAKLVNAE